MNSITGDLLHVNIKNLLSVEDIKNLTGASQHKKQADVLNDNGIYYITRADKTITTTWHHVNNPSLVRNVVNNNEPNFGAM